MLPFRSLYKISNEGQDVFFCALLVEKSCQGMKGTKRRDEENSGPHKSH